MKDKVKLRAIIICISVSLVPLSGGWCNTGDFLQICKPVRASSIANGGAGIYWGLDSLETNPAGSVGVLYNELNLIHLNYLNDFLIEKIMLGIPTGVGIISLNYTMMRSQKIPIITQDSLEGTGEYFNQENQSLGVTFARAMFFDNLFGGLTIKPVQMKLFKYQANTVLFNLGLLYYKSDYGIGVSINHIGGKLKFLNENEKIPIDIQLGLSMRMLKLKNNELTVLTDILKREQEKITLIIGVEYKFKEFVRFQSGYEINNIDNGISTGLCFEFRIWKDKKLGLGFTYSDIGVLGEKNGASVNLKI